VKTARPEERLESKRLQASLHTARLHAAIALWLHQQWQKRGLWARLCLPFAGLALGYVWVKRLWYQSNAKKVYRAPVPVIVVGNLYVGGVGKTPVVISLVQQLLAMGFHPGVISRGYGVDVGPTPRVGRGKLEPRAWGDEPTLISEQTNAAVCVHPNRRLACQALLKAYPEIDLIVSDDGLQHLALARDLEIIVQDQRLIGNGWLLPAGPLRESPSRIKTADLVITRQATPPQHSAPRLPIPLAEAAEQAHAPEVLTEAAAKRSVNQHPPELTMWLQITTIHSLNNKINLTVSEFVTFQGNKPTTAIAGISEPTRFFKTLSDAGVLYQNSLGLPDHHPLGAAFFEAQTADLLLVTSKDAVKCRALDDPRIWVVATEAVFSDATWAAKLVKQLPHPARSSDE
jgi:tetraacyldisaccharide 4'-kinase